MYGGETDDPKAIVENCAGLGECDDDIIKFHETINNENCPFQEEKIKEIIKCYNKNNKQKLNIDTTKNGLMELLDSQEDINDLQRATEWLDEKVLEPREALSENNDKNLDDYEFKHREALSENDKPPIMGGRKSRRRSRRPRKSIKTRKRRKTRRIRK
jgi:hypothetical protein